MTTRAMQGILLRVAEPSDAERLLTFTESTPGAPRWPRTAWTQILQSPVGGMQRMVLIAESVDECVGFGVLSLAADEAEIESLAVSAGWRRRGIAKRICEDLLGWAGARGAKHVSLEVRVSNSAARALYESLGFREAAVRRGYYREPEEDALVMARTL